RLGNGAAAVGLGGLDPALPAAPAELHEAALGQATVGDAACDGRLHERSRAGPEAQILIELAQLREGRREIECGLIASRRAEARGETERFATDRLVRGVEDDEEDAGLAGGDDAEVGDGATGLRLQAQRRELEQLRHPEVRMV